MATATKKVFEIPAEVLDKLESEERYDGDYFNNHVLCIAFQKKVGTFHLKEDLKDQSGQYCGDRDGETVIYKAGDYPVYLVKRYLKHKNDWAISNEKNDYREDWTSNRSNQEAYLEIRMTAPVVSCWHINRLFHVSDTKRNCCVGQMRRKELRIKGSNKFEGYVKELLENITWEEK